MPNTTPKEWLKKDRFRRLLEEEWASISRLNGCLYGACGCEIRMVCLYLGHEEMTQLKDEAASYLLNLRPSGVIEYMGVPVVEVCELNHVRVAWGLKNDKDD